MGNILLHSVAVLLCKNYAIAILTILIAFVVLLILSIPIMFTSFLRKHYVNIYLYNISHFYVLLALLYS